MLRILLIIAVALAVIIGLMTLTKQNTKVDEAVSGAVEATEDAGAAVGDAVEATGEAAGAVAEEAGDAVEPAAEAAGDMLEDAGATAGEAVDDAAAALRRLKASTADIERVGRIARGPAEPKTLEPVEVRRWLAAVGPAADDLLTLYQWRHGAVAPWGEVVERTRLLDHPIARGDLAISGDDLTAAGIGTGPRVGRVLSALLEAVLEDPDRNVRDELLRRARLVE